MRLYCTGPTDDLSKEQHEKLRHMLGHRYDLPQREAGNTLTLLHSGRPGVELAAAGIAAELGWKISLYQHPDPKPDHALVIGYSQGLPEPEEFPDHYPPDQFHVLAAAGIPFDVRFL